MWTLLAAAVAEPLPVALPAGSGPVALGLRLPDGVCRLADAGRRADGLELGPHAAALAGWARGQGALEAVDDGATPCDGGPPVHALAVPAGGWAVGLAAAPDGVAASYGADRLIPLGPDRTWWHLPAVAGEVAFRFPGGAPPALFRVVPDPARVPPEGWSVTLAEGEARGTPAAGSPVAAALEPPGVAAVVELGGRLVVVGLAAGTADGQVREGGAAAQPIHVAVTAPLRPPEGVVVPVGATRPVHLPPDAPALAEAVALDPAIAAVAEVAPGAFSVRGGSPGRTAVVWLDAEGTARAVGVIVAGR